MPCSIHATLRFRTLVALWQTLKNHMLHPVFGTLLASRGARVEPSQRQCVGMLAMEEQAWWQIFLWTSVNRTASGNIPAHGLRDLDTVLLTHAFIDPIKSDEAVHAQDAARNPVLGRCRAQTTPPRHITVLWEVVSSDSPISNIHEVTPEARKRGRRA